VLENIVEANCSPHTDVEGLQETTKYAGSVALNGRDSPPFAESYDKRQIAARNWKVWRIKTDNLLRNLLAYKVLVINHLMES
jgi:hypothetical protein